MNTHQAIRTGNEWQCPKCGKAWHVKDDDVPECTPTKEYSTSRLAQIKNEVSEPSNSLESKRKHLPFLLSRHQWIERRLDDIRFAIEICNREKIEVPDDWNRELENLITELTF